MEDGASGVLLHVLVVGDDAHNAVPDVVRHVVAREHDQVHDRVHIPADVTR